MNLSPHFTLAEMTFTTVRADNTPTDLVIVQNLTRLCQDYLEPLRARFGPYAISSGYRSPAVNRAIGGSKTSAHPRGCAADGRPVSRLVTLKEVMEYLVSSELDYDQVIYELGRWIHIGIADPGQVPRGMALSYFIDREGVGHYSAWNPNDPRVIA